MSSFIPSPLGKRQIRPSSFDDMARSTISDSEDEAQPLLAAQTSSPLLSPRKRPAEITLDRARPHLETMSGSAKRVPLIKRTYGRAGAVGGGHSSSTVGRDETARASSVEVPLIQVFGASKTSGGHEMKTMEVREEKENQQKLSGSSAPSSPSSVSSAERIATSLLPPARPLNLLDICKAKQVTEEALPSPTIHYDEENEQDFLAELTKVAVRDGWSRRKVLGRPGRRLVGVKAPVEVKKVGKAQQQKVQQQKAQQQPAVEPKPEEVVAMTRVSLKIIVIGDASALISVRSSASLTPLFPFLIQRNPFSTSSTYSITSAPQTVPEPILSIHLSSEVVAVPSEIAMPGVWDQDELKEWRLVVKDGRADWFLS